MAQDASGFFTRSRKVKLEHMRAHLAKGETALIAAAVDDYLREKGLHIDRSTVDWISVARLMMRAEIEALRRAEERDRGDFSGQPKDPIVKAPTQKRRHHTEAAIPGESIFETVDVFKRENTRNVSASRMNESCRDIAIFIETVGPGFPISNVNKKHVRDWKMLLMKYPVRATEIVDFRGMNISQIVEANAIHKRSVLSDRTVNRYLSSLSAYFLWAVSNGFINDNPCSGMSLAKERRTKTLPFTEEQMNTLFKSTLFVGAQSDTEWRYISRPGNRLIRDHRFWVPLIMLFSGARPGEIGQLAVSDVRQEHGHWTIHIRTEGETHGEGKSVKTAGSMRVVPVHPEFLRLGFLKYHADRVQAEGKQLFPGAKRNERGQMMSDFSREFGKYLTRIGIKLGRG